MARREGRLLPTMGLSRAVQSSPPLVVLLLLLSLISGLVLSVYSLRSEARLVGEDQLVGEAPPGTTIKDVNFTGYAFVESRLLIDLCGVSFHFLDSTQMTRFVEIGDLPPADLHCQKMRTLLGGDVAFLVVRSTREIEANYTLSFSFYRVSQPYALWALAGLPLTAAGGLGIALFLLRRGLGGVLSELSEAQKLEKKRRKKSGEEGSRREPWLLLSGFHPSQDEDDTYDRDDDGDHRQDGQSDH